jgi:hypothetical protein
VWWARRSGGVGALRVAREVGGASESRRGRHHVMVDDERLASQSPIGVGKKSVAGGGDFLFPVVTCQNRWNFSSLTGHSNNTFEFNRYNFSGLYFTGVLDPKPSFQTHLKIFFCFYLEIYVCTAG